MEILEKAYTFDDVLLVPAASTVLPREVQLKTRISREVNLNIPLVSAAMDTVTEAKLAISMAQEGGIGIIHKNMTPALQARCIQKVKRHESGVVKDPVTVSPDLLIKDVVDLSRKHKISSLPVLENNKVVGLVTNRDLRFEDRMDIPVSQVMTPRNQLVVVNEGTSIEDAKALMHQHKVERVLVVNDDWELKGLITVKDILNTTAFPNANKDNQGRLRVGAAVGVSDDTEERVAGLVSEGVDVIIVDTAHGHHESIIKRIQWIKNTYPYLQVIGGNIATGEAALDLVSAGADGVKVGIGPGSICTTRIIAGVGVPQLTAIHNVAKALKGKNIPIIADGGIRYSGDIAKALAAGADTVMLGSMFAGTDESPGEIELYQGRSYKSYRGMGSLAAMAKGSADRYFQGEASSEKLVPEGIEGRVPYKGPIVHIIHQLLGGLRSSMGYTGCASIDEMHAKAKFVEITAAGMNESHVHDVQITKEAPNYQAR
ncbi:IMP dehydrogenase [Neisseriaceae bacterium PsAf]|nr:IMP dehydrogenase [Neisseriaceae bacterium PsAf]MCV2502822.1 IMP dehydrogenase [Neisseriaceae bacterium]